MGAYDFRPEYRQLADARRRWPEAVCLALTATATILDLVPMVTGASYDFTKMSMSLDQRVQPVLAVHGRSGQLRLARGDVPDLGGGAYTLFPTGVEQGGAGGRMAVVGEEEGGGVSGAGGGAGGYFLLDMQIHLVGRLINDYTAS